MKFNTQSSASAAPHAARRNVAWAIDFAMLDFAHRPLVMLVVDIDTRRPLSATCRSHPPQTSPRRWTG
jgi:hypothetical protein